MKQAAPTCRQAAPHPVSCRGVQILQRSLALDLQVLGLLLPVGQLLLLVLQAGSYRSQWLSFCSHPAQSYSSWHDPDGTALFREAVRLGLGTIRKTQTWTTCSEITEQTAAVSYVELLVLQLRETGAAQDAGSAAAHGAMHRYCCVPILLAQCEVLLVLGPAKNQAPHHDLCLRMRQLLPEHVLFGVVLGTHCGRVALGGGLPSLAPLQACTQYISNCSMQGDCHRNVGSSLKHHT